MARARAEWRAKRAGKTSSSLWGFENWASEGTEGHHVARAKYGDLVIDVPISMHRELTRRQMEEHPEDGPDPEQSTGTAGSAAVWVWQTFASASPTCFAMIGEQLIRAAKEGASELKD